LLCFGCLVACGKAPLHHQEAFVFGTRVEVLIAGLDEAQARPAAAAVLREFDRLHRSYHAWKPSELSALNAAIAAGKGQAITPEMAALIVEAQRLTRLGEQTLRPRDRASGQPSGAFSPTNCQPSCQTPARWLPGERPGRASSICALTTITPAAGNINWRLISAAI
jgi:hypothetical protein